MDDNVINSYVKHRVKMALLWFAWLIAVLCPFVGQAQTTVEYIHTDALGSPVAVTNASGNVIEREVYEPYGSPITRPPSDQPGFTGHVADSLTGLTYMQQRYYDPQIGRFLSVDPVTAYSNPVGAFNRYWYANNNPYKFTDPDGRESNLKIPEWVSNVLVGRPSENDQRWAQQQVVRESFEGAVNHSVDTAPQSAVEAGKLVLTAAAFTPVGEVAVAGMGVKATAQGLSQILKPNGGLVGGVAKGATPQVRTVSSGAFKEIKSGLMDLGAKPAASPGSYKGAWYSLPDGQGGFGIRNSQKNGATIDFDLKEYPKGLKVHQQ